MPFAVAGVAVIAEILAGELKRTVHLSNVNEESDALPNLEAVRIRIFFVGVAKTVAHEVPLTG